MISSSRPLTGNFISIYSGVRSSRGLPPPQPTEAANSTQTRTEVSRADQIVVKESLQSAQVTAAIGDTVPLVFCREVSGVGGVLVSPPCVRAGFQVTAAGTVSANYLCVLSDGQLSSISESDVWHGGRKVSAIADASFGQGYGVIPANVALNSYFENGEDAFKYPLETGSGGSMAGLTLVGVRAVYEPEDGEGWNQQVHIFVRNGYPVSRLVDGVTGASNNFADLAKLLIQMSGRMPDALIDDESLVTAAKFTNAEGFFFNGVMASSVALKEYLVRVAPLFMLTVTSKNGKTGLMPSLPITSSFEIDTGVISPSASYGLEDMIAGSYRHQFIPLAERKFFRAVMNWREQPADDASVVRSTIVGYTGYAVNGPYETYDLSEFCASLCHAVKIGRFIVAQRKYVTHTIQFALKPERGNHEPGDIIRVNVNRISSADENLVFSRLYMVTSVTEQPSGEVSISATHFPVDDTGRSLVAQEISCTELTDPSSGKDQCPDPEPEPEPDDPDVPSATGKIIAFGGTVTTDGDYKIHTFTSNNTFVVASAPEGETIEYLIVGGGGAGGFGSAVSPGYAGGGGGGGGVLTGTFTPTVTGYPVAVGAGAQLYNEQGGSSSIFSKTAAGGGSGVYWSLSTPASFNSGSSGGGGASIGVGSGAAGSGTSGQGSAGGTGGANGNAGGGGGAGGAGSSAGAGGGAGGAGKSSSITGASIAYGGGGGGGSHTGSAGSGNGGGGAGSSGSASPTAGTNGRGGGGGGHGSIGLGGVGGSGVVIVRYRYQ